MKNGTKVKVKNSAFNAEQLGWPTARPYGMVVDCCDAQLHDLLGDVAYQVQLEGAPIGELAVFLPDELEDWHEAA